MEVRVNGEKKTFEGETIRLVDLLVQIGLKADKEGIAVAVNMEVVPRSVWGEKEIVEGDEVEVIMARQGG